MASNLSTQGSMTVKEYEEYFLKHEVCKTMSEKALSPCTLLASTRKYATVWRERISQRSKNWWNVLGRLNIWLSRVVWPLKNTSSSSLTMRYKKNLTLTHLSPCFVLVLTRTSERLWCKKTTPRSKKLSKRYCWQKIQSISVRRPSIRRFLH